MKDQENESSLLVTLVMSQGSCDGTIRLWDIRRSSTSACLHSFDQHRDLGSAPPSGRRPTVHSRPTELAKAHAGHVVSLAFTPDGRFLLSAGEWR